MCHYFLSRPALTRSFTVWPSVVRFYSSRVPRRGEKLRFTRFIRHFPPFRIHTFPIPRSTSLHNIGNRVVRKDRRKAEKCSLSVFCSWPPSYSSLDDRRDILWLASFSHLLFFSFLFCLFSPRSSPLKKLCRERRIILSDVRQFRFPSTPKLGQTIRSSLIWSMIIENNWRQFRNRDESFSHLYHMYLENISSNRRINIRWDGNLQGIRMIDYLVY